MPIDSEPPFSVQQALAALSQARCMRRGSLSERLMKCNRPGCSCTKHPEGRHGPYFSLTRVVAGSTRSRLLTAEQAKVARRQIESGQQFRTQIEVYWQVCEKWADAELEAPEAASPEAAKKGGSRRRSRRKSSPRSKNS